MHTTVRLKDVLFHAFHGLYENEKKAGNRFIINLEVSFIQENPKDLNSGVDYVVLYELTKNIMSSPQDLLESVGTDILKAVKSAFPFITSSTITITKQKPPIIGFMGQTEVSLSENY